MNHSSNSWIFRFQSLVIPQLFLFFWLPLFLAILFAVSWYRPTSPELLGWGEDPYFNLWTLEEVWKHLSSLGVWNVLSAEFWKTPIFSPSPNTLAFSENQIFAGLLSWPLRAWSHDGVMASNLFACFMSLATFLITWRWLASIGVKAYSAWGGLLFQACGWIQDQYAHYQNICIFVFPLALYAWNRFIRKPTLPHATLCAFCFGWVLGWNLYYQVFLNLVFASLITWVFFSKAVPKRVLLFLVCATALFEFPLALPYLKLESLVGPYKVSEWEYNYYSAELLSGMARGETLSFLHHFLPSYPEIRVSIEKVGFLGMTWTALSLIALKDSRSRLWIVASLLAFWIALGPHFGLMNLIQFFPGFQGTRAIGRIQILVALFSLAGLLLSLEKLPKRAQPFLLGLLLLELLPSGLSKQVPVTPGWFDGPPTPFEGELSKIPKTDPILILPHVSSKVQLALSRSDHSLWGGYSGRSPFNVQVLDQIGSNGLTPDSLKLKLLFSRTHTVVSLEEPLSRALQTDPFLQFQGCYSHFELNACLFSPKWSEPVDLRRWSQPLLALDRDTHWETLTTRQGQLDILKADHPGILEYAALGRCWLEQSYSFRSIPVWKRSRSLTLSDLHAIEVSSGDTILEVNHGARQSPWQTSITCNHVF